MYRWCGVHTLTTLHAHDIHVRTHTYMLHELCTPVVPVYTLHVVTNNNNNNKNLENNTAGFRSRLAQNDWDFPPKVK